MSLKKRWKRDNIEKARRIEDNIKKSSNDNEFNWCDICHCYFQGRHCPKTSSHRNARW